METARLNGWALLERLRAEAAAKAESPIEALLLHTFMLRSDLAVYRHGALVWGDRAAEWRLGVQQCVGRFRVDMLLQQRGCRPVVVECDGRDFHDSVRDAQRDAEILGLFGWSTIRFPGSKIFRAPRRCVEEALEAALWMSDEGWRIP